MSEDKKNYKDTLNLPNTSFPMKAKLTTKEVEIQKFWKDNNIYKESLKNDKNGFFYLHDGPPYANGNIHIGHSLNKILKDIIIKFKSIDGYKTPYIPGWDCHGLPIEHIVTKDMKHEDKISDPAGIRQKCRQYASKYIDIQREDFKRLGILGDWENPYITMDYKYESSIVEAFSKLYLKGYIYKGLKPIHWCSSCRTALAEAEVEYKEKQSPSIYVAFQTNDIVTINNNKYENLYIAIWTTTPWTLPSNLAVCINENINYVILNRNNKQYIVAEALLNQLFEKEIFTDKNIVDKFKGTEIKGLTYTSPLNERQGIVVSGNLVDLETGTGIIHIAPGHGQDDFNIGQQYNLPILSPVQDNGTFDDTTKYRGQHVYKANKIIIEELNEKGLLLGNDHITHSYPHCWRCKKPIIFRATPQWFLSMQHNDHRQKALEEVERVKWYPEWGQNRIRSMLEQRPDWCLSRQRVWGVPIPVLYCKECNTIKASEKIFNKIIDLTESGGTDIWFKYDATEFIDNDEKCEKCGCTEFIKETDILDVWFDSGVSYYATGKTHNDTKYPVDLYLEGSDQHRGWFQSTMLAGIGLDGRAPYNEVLTHGFVVDDKGHKMSKSLGNIIAPQDIIKTNGADILRLWVASSDYRDDIKISQNIIKQLIDAYRKFRNTFRYILGNINDFTENDSVSYNNLMPIDKYILNRFYAIITRIRTAYNNYDFHIIYHYLYNFCVIDLSALYLDVSKDRLYTDKKDSISRRSCQTTMVIILKELLKYLAPIISHTAEEVWQVLKETIDIETSVFLSKFEEFDFEYDKTIIEKWTKLLKFREEIQVNIEELRKNKTIGHSLDCHINIYDYNNILKSEFDDIDLRELFIVSKVDVLTDKNDSAIESDIFNNISFSIKKATGKKCLRCWVTSESVGNNPDEPDICDRCVSRVVG